MPAHLPTEDLQLVRKDEKLEFLRAVRARDQHGQGEQTPQHEIERREERDDSS